MSTLKIQVPVRETIAKEVELPYYVRNEIALVKILSNTSYIFVMQSEYASYINYRVGSTVNEYFGEEYWPCSENEFNAAFYAARREINSIQ